MNSLACTEIFELFEILGKEYRKKIPNKFWDFIEKNKLKTYDKEKINKDLWNGNISDDALNLYSALKFKYLCEDEFEKKILSEIYNYNRNNLNIKKKQIYENLETPVLDDLFKKQPYNKTKEKTDLVVVKEETFFSKILKQIKKFFKKS